MGGNYTGEAKFHLIRDTLEIWAKDKEEKMYNARANELQRLSRGGGVDLSK